MTAKGVFTLELMCGSEFFSDHGLGICAPCGFLNNNGRSMYTGLYTNRANQGLRLDHITVEL